MLSSSAIKRIQMFQVLIIEGLNNKFFGFFFFNKKKIGNELISIALVLFYLLIRKKTKKLALTELDSVKKNLQLI